MLHGINLVMVEINVVGYTVVSVLVSVSVCVSVVGFGGGGGGGATDVVE